MNRTKRAVFCILTALSAGAFGMLAYSYWLSEKNTENILTMASYKASLVENYKAPSHVDPAQSVKKKVQVKNEGTVDILVRVSVRKEFGVRGKSGVFLADKTLDGDMIEIDFNTTDWKKRADGWFYYQRILKAGETTQPLMESYRLSEHVGNRYGGKDAQIVVCMESVQAEGNALSVWNVTYQDLGIARPSTFETRDTGVVFYGKDRGFEVNAQNTDLFASFKNLLPGCGRSQKVTVENKSDEAVEICLRAQPSAQAEMSAKKKQLVEQLLQTYAQIEVREDGRTLYRGAVCGQDAQDSMQSEISLGNIAPGSTKELTVDLSLSPEMDNQFEDLAAKVIWVFSARGEDGTVIVESNVPRTGDDSAVILWAFLLAVSSLAAGLSVWTLRGRRRRARQRVRKEMRDEGP